MRDILTGDVPGLKIRPGLLGIGVMEDDIPFKRLKKHYFINCYGSHLMVP